MFQKIALDVSVCSNNNNNNNKKEGEQRSQLKFIDFRSYLKTLRTKVSGNEENLCSLQATKEVQISLTHLLLLPLHSLNDGKLSAVEEQESQEMKKNVC